MANLLKGIALIYEALYDISQ